MRTMIVTAALVAAFTPSAMAQSTDIQPFEQTEALRGQIRACFEETTAAQQIACMGKLFSARHQITLETLKWIIDHLGPQPEKLKTLLKNADKLLEIAEKGGVGGPELAAMRELVDERLRKLERRVERSALHLLAAGEVLGYRDGAIFVVQVGGWIEAANRRILLDVALIAGIHTAGDPAIGFAADFGVNVLDTDSDHAVYVMVGYRALGIDQRFNIDGATRTVHVGGPGVRWVGWDHLVVDAGVGFGGAINRVALLPEDRQQQFSAAGWTTVGAILP